MTLQNTNNTNKKQKRMVPLRYVLMPFAIIMLGVLGLIVMGALAPKPAKKPIIVKAPLVDVMPITYSDKTFFITSQGSVVPRTETNLVSEVSGIVTDVSKKYVVGGFFKKGEEILRIDDITYQVAVLQAQARLGSAQAKLVEEKARSAQAKDEWMLTGKKHEEAPQLALRVPQLQQAKADLIAAEADLKEAKVKLERTKILAPYDAMLKAKQVDIGQYVTTGTVLAHTFAVDYAEVRLPVRHRDVNFLNLPRINSENDTTSSIELYYKIDGKKYQWTSSLTRYEGVVDASNRVHYIVAQVNDPYNISPLFDAENKQEEIHIGTFVNADIEGKKLNNVIAIPREAIHGERTLYLVDQNNLMHIDQINVLRADDKYIYSQQEFNNTYRIVLTNIETPIEGMKLRIAGEEAKEKTTEQTAKELVEENTSENGDS